jgi:hypothetical protein
MARPLLTSRHARTVLQLLAVGLAIVLLRSATIRAPQQSDDMLYVALAEKLRTGDHALSLGTASSQLELRFGLVAPLALIQALAGKNLLAYYAIPLAFVAIGAWMVFVVARDRWGQKAAWPLLALLLALPQEAHSASQLMPNLPSAVCGLAAVLLITRPSTTSLAREAALGSTCGALAAYVYMLRDKEAVLLIPAFLFACYRRKGGVRLIACAGSALGLVLMEQAVYVAHGHAFGWRWEVLRSSFEAYWPFWERVNLHYFLVRPFLFPIRDFGPVGVAVQCALFLALCMTILRCRDVSLQAVALNGLVHFLVMSYYVFGVDRGQFVVMNSDYRFYHPFHYSGVVSVGWVVRHWLERAPFPPVQAGQIGTALGILGLWVAALKSPERLLSSEATHQRLLATIDLRCPGAGPVHMWTPDLAVSAYPLLTDALGKRPLVWLHAPPVGRHPAHCTLALVQWNTEERRCRYLAEPDPCQAAVSSLRGALEQEEAQALVPGVVVYGPLRGGLPQRVVSPRLPEHLGY